MAAVASSVEPRSSSQLTELDSMKNERGDLSPALSDSDQSAFKEHLKLKKSSRFTQNATAFPMIVDWAICSAVSGICEGKELAMHREDWKSS
jgi:hypothetical protein